MTTKAKAAKATTANKTEAEDVTADASGAANSAREFVKRTASSAKERAETIHEGSLKLNANMEQAMTGIVSGYASFLSNIADATHANVEHALVTVEKVAAAGSVSEALKIQADFVRENTTANFERVRDAANGSREMLAEGAATIRENAANAWPYGKKAA